MHDEIDETVITPRKHKRGHLLKAVWIVGGIYRETDKAFVLIAPDWTAPSLNDGTKSHITDGSIIYPCT